MAIHIPVGTAQYGTLFHRRGGSSSTTFWFLGYFPLIPIGGERHLVDERGVVHTESRLFLPSLLLALFNSWGLVALLFLFNRAFFESGHTMAKTVQALAMGGALFTSWVWGGGRWRFPEERRATFIKAAVLSVVALVGGAVLVTETLDSVRSQAEHQLDGLSPLDRMKVLATDLKTQADRERAEGQRSFERSCSEGDQSACVRAARPLEATDLAKAQAVYQRACEANVGLGCSFLGLTYRYAATPNLSEARRLMTRACDLKDGFGCYHLGSMAQLGSGAARDPAAAAAFFKLGCEFGYQPSCKEAGLGTRQTVR